MMRHAGRRQHDGESSEEMLIGDLVGPLPTPTDSQATNPSDYCSVPGQTMKINQNPPSRDRKESGTG